MQKNFKLIIEYDGTGFQGWQIQPDARTVQEEIQKAIGKMTRENITLIGAGRTDAGVHALGMAAHFQCDTRISADEFLKGLNSILRADIVIRSCAVVHPSFHARYDARSKLYRYHILNRNLHSALRRNFLWHIRSPLDMDDMRQGAEYIKGRHDFKAFEGTGSPRAHSVRNVMRAELSRGGDYITFEIEADGFLRYMVRNIVGTLVHVGLGKFTPEDVGEILASKDRGRAGITAPPQGLFLVKVDY
jgi:tRNA pseudouridine38-40 synthase